MKRTLLTLILTVFIGMEFVFTASPQAQAKTIKLTYSNFFPPTHIQSKLAEEWCQEVEKRTDGKVMVQYFPGQTLTKATQAYDGVVTGLSDIGVALPAYTRGRFPVMTVVDLPLGYTSGKAATMVANDVYHHFNPKELSDTKVMYLHAHGPGILNTKGKAVCALEDLKGLKLRGHGASAEIAKALGATPVSMPMPELYQSLQKGVVEGAFYPMEVNKGWKMGEVTDYTTQSFPIAYTSSFFVVMNKDKWAALPADIQKTIEAINQEWIPKHAAAWDGIDQEAYELAKIKHRDIIQLAPEEASRWKEAVRGVIDKYSKAMDKKGINGKEVVDYTVETLKKYQQ